MLTSTILKRDQTPEDGVTGEKYNRPSIPTGSISESATPMGVISTDSTNHGSKIFGQINNKKQFNNKNNTN